MGSIPTAGTATRCDATKPRILKGFKPAPECHTKVIITPGRDKHPPVLRQEPATENATGLLPTALAAVVAAWPDLPDALKAGSWRWSKPPEGVANEH